MESPLDKLKKKVFDKKTEYTPVETLSMAAKTFGAAFVLGTEYEVRDCSGKIIARIRQKPASLVQLNSLMRGIDTSYEKAERSKNNSSARKRKR